MNSTLNRLRQKFSSRPAKTVLLVALSLFFLGGLIWHPAWGQSTPAAPALSAVQAAAPAPAEKEFHAFALFTDPAYTPFEKVALCVVLLIAFAGLGYAWMLVGEVTKADKGTPKMQAIAAAVREGADAYLAAQFKKILPLIIGITLLLFFANTTNVMAFKLGRAGAFLVGSLFSFLVGYCGMKLATIGNLRVAAAARKSYGTAMQLGYRTGTVTGMLTDGLGLLGGTIIFLIFSEKAYEALLGFGFGGTLIALFMRVGGGIYTKAADVGADLVGKIEKNIPEDDPRNAATIADNVGDNVGDCAGMAADIFESYEVTIVAAMILGMASFGHIGVIFPLLVRGIGVLGSIISTYTVKAGEKDTSDTALKSVHRGFWIGSMISVIGFFVLGFGYLRISDTYIKSYPQALGGYVKNAQFVADAATEDKLLDQAFTPAQAQERAEAYKAWVQAYKGPMLAEPSKQTFLTNFGLGDLDVRPALTCLIGVILAIVLNKQTSYFTHTSHSPVKGLVEACRSGHATNIIEGIAVGYESAVAAVIVLGAAVLLSVLCYQGMPPVFIAFGVAMAGIGMLTLTGNTISMDVFGPVADNANGIGEMGYDKAEMEKAEPGSYARARQVLADLDAVGNTTKAETKGIAIGSAVIAAVSLFASFIAVIAVGSEENIPMMTTSQYLQHAGQLTVAQPLVFLGLLGGAAVPFLFSSMLVRAVGRAASLIVGECRIQFRDKEIWAGTKKPNYGRVVDICTNAAQKELIGPCLLAVCAPLLVGFLLGPYALGGFLAGMIASGLLLAVFMANAGGAWDNAKKMIEDGLYGGKGSEAHKAAVTGDTVGDPLKDTAGPAVNPLIKVMNMVSLLALTLVIRYTAFYRMEGQDPGYQWVGIVVTIICVGAIGWAVLQSKRETPSIHDEGEAATPAAK